LQFCKDKKLIVEKNDLNNRWNCIEMIDYYIKWFFIYKKYIITRKEISETNIDQFEKTTHEIRKYYKLQKRSI